MRHTLSLGILGAGFFEYCDFQVVRQLPKLQGLARSRAESKLVKQLKLKFLVRVGRCWIGPRLRWTFMIKKPIEGEALTHVSY